MFSVPRGGIAALYVNAMFHLLRNFQTVPKQLHHFKYPPLGDEGSTLPHAGQRLLVRSLSQLALPVCRTEVLTAVLTAYEPGGPRLVGFTEAQAQTLDSDWAPGSATAERPSSLPLSCSAAHVRAPRREGGG